MTIVADVGVGAPWRPILPEALARQALEAVDAIVTALGSLSPGGGDASLAGGQAGLAILDAWALQAGRTGTSSARVCQRLDHAFDNVSSSHIDASFYMGFTGVAWAADVIDHLLDPAGEDRNGEVDEVLLRLVSGPPLTDTPHDLVVGVTGIGVYALERHPRPVAAEVVRHVVEQLHASSHHDDDGTYWWTPPEAIPDSDVRKRYPSGRVDLGVAHGMGGAIALLGAICGARIACDTARPLLEEAVRWLRAHSITTGGGPTFPVWVAEGVRPVQARCAWCYGDPGLAAALLVAGRGLGDDGLTTDAVALACRAAERPPADAGVLDASFCHGAAGLAHLYNRMYQATGELTLRRAAVYWIERTLEYFRSAAGEGGSWVWGTEDPMAGPWTGVNVIEGAAGVALVLLAAATPVEPSWDRMFLASAPHNPPGDVS